MCGEWGRRVLSKAIGGGEGREDVAEGTFVVLVVGGPMRKYMGRITQRLEA